MLSSKELMARGGISRATLNNYIALGILPRPVVRREGKGAPRLGYFPASALTRLERVNRLKREGFSMSEIARLMNREESSDARPANSSPAAPGTPRSVRVEEGGLRLTLERIDFPAYMVNNNFEIEWSNAEANTTLLGQSNGLPSEIEERNLFRLMLGHDAMRRAEGLDEILRFHFSIAKARLNKTFLLKIDLEDDGALLDRLTGIFDEVEPIRTRSVLHTSVNLAPRGEGERWHTIYASFFREGIFFVYAPSSTEGETLMSMLARRDLVIRDILKNRRPYMTPLAVLVADLQDSVKICAELPPEEYFELINHIWGVMEPKLRKYYATHGKHVGDGMVYYFFPQPDCSHIANAIWCAHEMRETMREVSREWRSRKNWLNDLVLNIGLDEGEEWFGSYQTPTHLEFTVLGDTINMAARISDFARDGSVWATKNMLGKLTSRERARIRYGIRRRGDHGEEILVPATYSRLANLIDLEDAKYYKFRDIGALTVTEVLDVMNEAEAEDTPRSRR